MKQQNSPSGNASSSEELLPVVSPHDSFPPEFRTYNQDGLITMHNTNFATDFRFAAAYTAGKAAGSWGGADIHWRAHVLCWVSSIASRLPGDFVECGTNRGGTAALVREYARPASLGKTFFLLDTFSGLDPEFSSEDEQERLKETYTDCYEEVVERFAPYSEIVIIRGAVPTTLPQVTTDKVAYLHIDLNAVRPEIAALDHFWPLLSPGAPVIFDDYAWVACSEQLHAHDRWAKEKGVSILSLPTGQGLLFKPPMT